MDIGEPIKFRVSSDIFEESSPIGPPSSEKPSSSSQSDIKTPYRILVSINSCNILMCYRKYMKIGLYLRYKNVLMTIFLNRVQ